MSRENKHGTQPPKQKSERFYRTCYKIFAGPIRFIWRVKVIGRENEPTEGPFLVCANHQSNMDPVLVCASFRKNPVGFMAKSELFFWPLGPLIRALGAYPVNRGSSADVGAIRTSLDLLEEGRCVGIFPQGRRFAGVDPKTTPVKGGAGMICSRASVPVVPVYLRRKNCKSAFLRKTEIVIGKPIPVEELAFDPEASGEYLRLSGLIFDHICALENVHDRPRS